MRRGVKNEEGIHTSKELNKDIEDVVDYLHSENNSENPTIFKFYVRPGKPSEIIF